MQNKLLIDLNLDAGEDKNKLFDGSEEQLYPFVTSVNIACGGHAGDDATMEKAIELALKYSLKIGAHPSFPDKENFGRKNLEIELKPLIDSLQCQIQSLQKICYKLGAQLTHIKPHGALYNLAAENENAALAIIQAVQELKLDVQIVGLAGSKFIERIRSAKLSAIEEAFADRVYEKSGALRSRQFENALIEDPEVASSQALLLATEKKVKCYGGELIYIAADSICIHSDSPNALAVAKAVHSKLIY